MVRPRTRKQFDLASASNSQVNHVPIVHATPPNLYFTNLFLQSNWWLPSTPKALENLQWDRWWVGSASPQNSTITSGQHSPRGWLPDGAQRFCPDTADTASLASSWAKCIKQMQPAKRSRNERWLGKETSTMKDDLHLHLCLDFIRLHRSSHAHPTHPTQTAPVVPARWAPAKQWTMTFLPFAKAAPAATTRRHQAQLWLDKATAPTHVRTYQYHTKIASTWFQSLGKNAELFKCLCKILQCPHRNPNHCMTWKKTSFWSYACKE